MSIDRTTMPSFTEVKGIELLPMERPGDVGAWPVYALNAGLQDVVRIDLAFYLTGGSRAAFMADRAANAMLRDGTKSRSFLEMAEILDGYGSHLGLHTEGNHAFVTLYALNRNLAHVIPVLRDLVMNATYPQDPFDVYRSNQVQTIRVNQKKVAKCARERFLDQLFGDQHMYGFTPVEEDVNALKREDVLKAHARVYGALGHYAFVAGKLPDTLGEQMRELLADIRVAEKMPDLSVPAGADQPDRVFIPVEGSVQAAIRIGKRTVSKIHPDYPGLQVLNTILGGYFGSRLMTNIREDKGYTYGISSGVASLPDAGYFFIATEVGGEVCGKAIREINHELDRLRTEPIPAEELDLVRNYLLGSLMRSADGPFGQADMYKGLLHYGLDIRYLENLVETIRVITPQQLRDLALKYLDPSTMHQVVAGPEGCMD